jgi:hypothetical protein
VGNGAGRRRPIRFLVLLLFAEDALLQFFNFVDFVRNLLGFSRPEAHLYLLFIELIFFLFLLLFDGAANVVILTTWLCEHDILGGC